MAEENKKVYFYVSGTYSRGFGNREHAFQSSTYDSREHAEEELKNLKKIMLYERKS